MNCVRFASPCNTQCAHCETTLNTARTISNCQFLELAERLLALNYVRLAEHDANNPPSRIRLSNQAQRWPCSFSRLDDGHPSATKSAGVLRQICQEALEPRFVSCGRRFYRPELVRLKSFGLWAITSHYQIPAGGSCQVSRSKPQINARGKCLDASVFMQHNWQFRSPQRQLSHQWQANS
jgi:hypothetical protein